ncbi:TetR/AcrR family transcriptional regulator [Kibdelosporangium lantanae]
MTDKRLLRGARTRQTVLRRAVDIASVEGLEGLSFGRLATDTGLSKAGIQTLFRTKESLQLATIDHARTLIVDAIIRPALPAPHGLQRLRAVIENWIAYVELPLFEGGCFRVANLAEFDSRPGPVRDAFVRDQRKWLDGLANEIRHAVANGEIEDVDPDLTAFQLDAAMCATNTSLRLGEPGAVERARRIVGLLVPPRRN